MFTILLLLFGINSSWGLDLVKIDKQNLSILQDNGIEFISDHFSHPRFAVGYIGEPSITKILLQKNIVTPLEEMQWAMGAYNTETFELQRIDPKVRRVGYHNYKAATEELKKLSSLYPQFLKLFSAGRSVQGRELWYLVFTNFELQEDKPKFIYHANMHGDEVVGRELMLYLVQHMIDRYQKDSRITQLVDHSILYVMPSMNPDGFELGTRANAKGKDLNRNFPDRFKSPSDTSENREIEVQHMMKLAAENHFVYGINWHGGEICFNLPWGNIENLEKNKFGDDSFFHPIGREYTELNPGMYKNHQNNFNHGLTYGYEWYPVNGGINDWFNFYRRSLHAVVELSVTKWPSAGTLQKFWDSNREAMVTYLYRGLRGLHLHVKSKEGANIIRPTLQLAELPKRLIEFDNGFIHRITGDGKWTAVISAPGFRTKTVEVPASYFHGEYTAVELEK